MREKLGTSFLLVLYLFTAGCHPRTTQIDPTLCYIPTIYDVAERRASLPLLSENELQEEWARELLIGEKFSEELDLYRAITAYKRSLFLVPPEEKERRTQIEYGIVSAYFIAERYDDVVRSFDESKLKELPKDSPFFEDLLVMLILSYEKICDPYKAQILFNLLEQTSPERAEKLELSKAITRGDLAKLQSMRASSSQNLNWIDCYCIERLSPQTAQLYNALLPGAGYLYVGQKRTALTSFLLNAAFIAATVQFFRNGNTAAGVITASLEFGWYAGGINGAGLAVKEYNDHRYSFYAREAMVEGNLFPSLMIQHAF